MDGVEFNAPLDTVAFRSFRRRSSQPITWLILTNKTVQENTDKQTQYKSEKVNNLKYSTTKLTWFSCLLQHWARKRGGLILHRPRAHTAPIAKFHYTGSTGPGSFLDGPGRARVAEFSYYRTNDLLTRLRNPYRFTSGVTSHRQPRQCRGPRGPKRKRGPKVTRIMYQDCY